MPSSAPNPKFFLEDLVVREGEEDDVPSIAVIYGEAVNAFGSFEIKAPGEAELKIRMRLIAIAKCPYIIAEYKRKIVGYAHANAYRAGPAYNNTVESFVYVRDGFKRKGIGRKLLLELMNFAAEAGFRQMIATIADSGNQPVIQLYEKLGFKPAGMLRSVAWKHERWIDAVLMQCPLGEGDQAPLLK